MQETQTIQVRDMPVHLWEQMKMLKSRRRIEQRPCTNADLLSEAIRLLLEQEAKTE